MITLPALPAAPARSAEPAERPADSSEHEGSGFATALAQARGPRSADHDDPSGCRAAADERTNARGGRSTDTQTRPCHDGTGRDHEATADTTPDGPAAEVNAETDAEATSPDLAALLPGWPPAQVVPLAAPTTTNAPTSSTMRSGRGPLSIDTVGDDAARTLATNATDDRSSASPLDTALTAQDARQTPSAPATGARFERLLATNAARATEAVDKEQRLAAATTQAPADPGGSNMTTWQASATALAASAPVGTPASAQNTANLSATVHEARIAAPVDSPAFAPALASQITWMANEGVQQARLSLHPAEMGPLTVQIVVDGTQARIDFGADLAATRHAIEASLPILAAALHDSGLTLSGGGVSDGQARQSAPEGRTPTTMPGAALGNSARADAPPGLGTPPMRHARGLVDLVA